MLKVESDPTADTWPTLRATVWRYVDDLAKSDGYDLSVVPPLFH